MATATWVGAHVTAIDLDPGVGGVVTGAARQPDHQLGMDALLSEQAEEDQRPGQAPWAPRADSEDAVDRSTQSSGRIGMRPGGAGGPEFGDELGQRVAPEADHHGAVARQDTSREADLAERRHRARRRIIDTTRSEFDAEPAAPSHPFPVSASCNRNASVLFARTWAASTSTEAAPCSTAQATVRTQSPTRFGPAVWNAMGPPRAAIDS